MDMVYGIGVDVFDSFVVVVLLLVKGWGCDMLVGVLVGFWYMIEGLVYFMFDGVCELICVFWFGVFSLVVV